MASTGTRPRCALPSRGSVADDGPRHRRRPTKESPRAPHEPPASPRRHRSRRLGALVTAPAASTASTETTAEPVVGPYRYNFSTAFAYSLINPDAEAQGVNDYGCTPKAGTQPVILVHGTFANQYDSFARMAPELTWAGYCVYSFNYGTTADVPAAQLPGRYGLTGLSQNGDELAAFAQQVRTRTGATEVDMIGWSQGGTIITDVLKKHGGGGVDDVVTYHGTTLSGLATLAEFFGVTGVAEGLAGQGPLDQRAGSPYIEQLTADGDTVPGVDYTVVATCNDRITTPYRSTFLEQGPGATVKNITLQDGCWLDQSSHLSMMYSSGRSTSPSGRCTRRAGARCAACPTRRSSDALTATRRPTRRRGSVASSHQDGPCTA